MTEKQKVARRAYARKLYKINKRKNPAKVREQQTLHTNTYRSKAENRVKRNARRKVEYEISMGRLKKKPCRKCGARKSQAHHKDYSKPLVILWLCALHHREYERKHPVEPVILSTV